MRRGEMIGRMRLSTMPAPIASGEKSGQPGEAGCLQGLIPFSWLAAAARLPGKSLHAGVALWYAACPQTSGVVPLSNIAAHMFGLDRNAKYRALDWLERAGLIKVERKLGRAPMVTILDKWP
jgi:DNA-binding transcriptional ArsR family regulator